MYRNVLYVLITVTMFLFLSNIVISIGQVNYCQARISCDLDWETTVDNIDCNFEKNWQPEYDCYTYTFMTELGRVIAACCGPYTYSEHLCQ